MQQRRIAMFFFQEGFTYRNFLLDALAIFFFIVWFWLLITVASDLFRRHGARSPQSRRIISSAVARAVGRTAGDAYRRSGQDGKGAGQDLGIREHGG
jgi:hypothetical protein